MKNIVIASIAALTLAGSIGAASAQESRSERDTRTSLGIAGAVLGGGYGRPRYGCDRFDDPYDRHRCFERRRYRDRYDD